MVKKRITPEEYNILPEEEKKKFKEMHFDEEFHPGNGEDIDYSYRVFKEGWRIYRANFGIDHHRLSEHINDQDMDVQKIIKRNGEYFKKKHKLK